jgi:hypothetical protein
VNSNTIGGTFFGDKSTTSGSTATSSSLLSHSPTAVPNGNSSSRSNNTHQGTIVYNVVIAGAGIMGTSVAYYLKKKIKSLLSSSSSSISSSSSSSSSSQVASVAQRRRRRRRRQLPMDISNNDDDNDEEEYLLDVHSSWLYNITVIDPVGCIAPCASGKAGGLLAKNWRDGTPLEELQRAGFDLHQELANELVLVSSNLSTTTSTSTNTTVGDVDTIPSCGGMEDNSIGYRRLTCAAISIIEEEEDEYEYAYAYEYEDEDESEPTALSSLSSSSSSSSIRPRRRTPKKPPSRKLQDVQWVDLDTVLDVVQMGDERTIAQVHPKKLCQAMWTECCTAWDDGTNDVPNSTDNTEDVDDGGDGTPASLSSSSSSASASAICNLQKGRIVRAILRDTDDTTVPSTRTTTTTTNTVASPHIDAVELEDGTILSTDILVIACGPWTYEANDWFDRTKHPSIMTIPDITGVKCHSILIRPTATPTTSSTSSSSPSFSQAVFFDSDGALGDGDLEVYPRPDGDCYVNGFPAAEGLVTERPGEETLDETALESLEKAMAYTSSKELFFHTPPQQQQQEDAFTSNYDNSQSKSSSSSSSSMDIPSDSYSASIQSHTRQVCYWPETVDGLPFIGPLPGVDGVYVATGHSVWGILHGPVTGRAIAELILDGQSRSVKIEPFGLDRFQLQ